MADQIGPFATQVDLGLPICFGQAKKASQDFENDRHSNLQICMSKHIGKIYLKAKFPPFRIKDDRYIVRSFELQKIHLGC